MSKMPKQPTTIKHWLTAAQQQIAPLDAELILLSALKSKTPLDRSYLSAHAEDELSPKIFKKAQRRLSRRKKSEPLAYILGHKEFYGREFKVNKNVLIPRPESESIIRLALELRPKKVLEIGTGSGCLAITLAAELEKQQKVKITATDKSLRALAVAWHNAIKTFGHEPSVTLDFIKSDLLQNVEQPRSYDLIIANLPYVDKNWDFLDHETLRYEPALALYAKDHGLALIKKLIAELKEAKYHGHLILEADPNQHSTISQYLAKEPSKTDGFALLFKL